jgi:hypothetical protein
MNRYSERNRLASHLAATLSYLWIKALLRLTRAGRASR